MTKQLSSVGLALAVAMVSALAGCQLYFGDTHDRDDRGHPGGFPSGYECTTDLQCAAGCFCADGRCEEGGFCRTDADCGDGFHCDGARSSCVPNPSCVSDDQCKQGSTCDPVTGGCVATCTCASDAEAIAKGQGWCDEARGTCMPGADPAGACNNAITCTTPGPDCAKGEVPLVKDGCYTGACRPITACEAPPACNALQHEDDCKARTADCQAIRTGHNCTGDTCGQPGGVCVCEFYTYSACENRTAAGVTIIPES